MLTGDEEAVRISELEHLFLQDSNDFTPEEKLLVTDKKNNTWRRFLVAQKWSTVKALENIKSMVLWRRDFKPSDLGEVEKLHDSEKGAFTLHPPSTPLTTIYAAAIFRNIYHSGYDLDGRPIIYIKKSEGVERPEVQLRWYVSFLHLSISRAHGTLGMCICSSTQSAR
jgi:hypothetical protein